LNSPKGTAVTQALAARLDGFSPAVLGIFRIVVGLFFAMHGTVKLFGWPMALSGGTTPFGQWPYWWAGVIEVVVGLLLMLGLFTRPAAILGSGTMAYAYFTAHQPKALWPIQNGGEPAALFCFAMLLIAFSGAGAFAVDSVIRQRSSRE
jgi:putative oxidoreductase